MRLKEHIGYTAEDLFQELAMGRVESDPFERDAAGMRSLIKLRPSSPMNAARLSRAPPTSHSLSDCGCYNGCSAWEATLTLMA